MRLKKKLLGIMVCFALVLSLMPGMSLTTYAAEPTVITVTGANYTYSQFQQEGVVIRSGGAGDDNTEGFEYLGEHGWFYPPKGYCFTKIEVTKGKIGNNGSAILYEGRTPDGVTNINSIYNSNTGLEVQFTVVPYEVYNVTLHTDGGTINSGNITSYTEFGDAQLPTDVTKTGYTFEGWYTNSDLSGDKVEWIYDSTGDKEFWAKWTESQSSGGDSSDSGNSGSSSGSSSSSNTSSGTSSSSSSSTSTSTPAPATVPYDKVVISTGAVNDITGTAAATAESNPFGTKIENNDNLTTLLSLTPEEVAQGVNVWLDIKDMSATVPQAEKDIVQNASANFTVGMYLDINLFKKVGGNAATKITETNGAVKASILIPESLWKAGRTFEIIRVHDGVPTVISGTYDENTHVFTFETDKFSTYALAYNDSANSTQSTAPRTGDNNHLGVWYLLLAVSLGGLGYLGYTKKKRVNK